MSCLLRREPPRAEGREVGVRPAPEPVSALQSALPRVGDLAPLVQVVVVEAVEPAAALAPRHVLDAEALVAAFKPLALLARLDVLVVRPHLVQEAAVAVRPQRGREVRDAEELELPVLVPLVEG